MTAMNPATAARIGEAANPDSARDQASACRKLWATVVLRALNDWWNATRRTRGDKAAIARIRADALRYFTSRDGLEVVALAGLTADPERLADAAVDLDARDRTIRDMTERGDE